MKKSRKHHRRAKSHRRRRSYRRNPVAGLAMNPRRRRRSYRTHRRSHRRYRRNPAFLRMGKLGLPPVKEIAFLSAGAIGARMGIPLVLAKIPMLSSNGYIRAASRIALAAVASMLATKFLKGNAKPFVYGVLANQVPEAINDVAAQAGIKLGLEEPENALSLASYYGNVNRPLLAEPEVGMYTGMMAGDEVGSEVAVG